MQGTLASAAAVLIGFRVLAAVPAPAAGVQLTIVTENVRSATGVVGALIFNSPRGWPENVDDSIRREAVPAQTGTTILTFKDLPPGEYAVVVLHDENENMKLDKGPLGVPREGWGMSNNPRAQLSAPPFDRAKFTLTTDTTLRIHLNY